MLALASLTSMLYQHYLYKSKRLDYLFQLKFRQGEIWHNLRTKLTSQITSPRVLQSFLPELNNICDDFIDLLRSKRNSDTNIVDNFQNIVNLFGLEAGDYNQC